MTNEELAKAIDTIKESIEEYVELSCLITRQWCLYAWQAHIRYLAKDYEHITVCSRPGHQFLYEDFCDEYHEGSQK